MIVLRISAHPFLAGPLVLRLPTVGRKLVAGSCGFEAPLLATVLRQVQMSLSSEFGAGGLQAPQELYCGVTMMIQH